MPGQEIFDQLQALHIAAWNEKDASKRTALLETIYATNITMYDKDNVFSGLTEVSAFIGQLISSDPSFTFSASKPIEALQNGARLFGAIQTGQGLLMSMDFFLLDENHQVKLLYAFLEPAGA